MSNGGVERGGVGRWGGEGWFGLGAEGALRDHAEAKAGREIAPIRARLLACEIEMVTVLSFSYDKGRCHL